MCAHTVYLTYVSGQHLVVPLLFDMLNALSTNLKWESKMSKIRFVHLEEYFASNVLCKNDQYN